MTAPHDLDRQLSAYLMDGPTELPDPSFDAVRDNIEPMRQRAFIGPWRFPAMNNVAKVLVATAAVVVVAVAGISLLPGSQSGTGGLPPAASPSTLPPSPSPSPSPSPTPEPTASLVTHTLTPFDPVGVEGEKNPRAASMTLTFTAPASWERFGGLGLWIDDNAPPDGANVFFYRGGDLYSEPCLTDEEAGADVPVGPTVDDLVTALVDHPSLDVTDPVDVTLAGYSGTYLDLTIPPYISACANFQPMDGHHYAQGPGQRWHMWILDVDGVRVLVETNDYPGTPPERLAEEQAIIESLVITP